MRLTDIEKGVLQWAIRTARDTLAHNSDPEDPYKDLMLHELLDICESEVQELVPDSNKYADK